MRVLITCGATWVPIDDVRVISNISSGEMGHLIAEAFSLKGAQVTVIEGPATHFLSNKRIRTIKYRFFDELSSILKQELVKKYDIIIHAAAVSDFRITRVSKNKISSDKALSLNLTATPKLIKDIKRLSPESFLVGFKLESNLNLKNIFNTVKPLFTDAACDLVVANMLKSGKGGKGTVPKAKGTVPCTSRGQFPSSYQGYILNADGDILSIADNKQKLAKELVKIFY